MALLNYDKLFIIEKTNNIENAVLFYAAYYLVKELVFNQ